jgi:hypothetical protein
LAAALCSVYVEVFKRLAFSHQNFAATKRVQRLPERSEKNKAVLHAHRPSPPPLHYYDTAAAQSDVTQVPQL